MDRTNISGRVWLSALVKIRNRPSRRPAGDGGGIGPVEDEFLLPVARRRLDPMPRLPFRSELKAIRSPSGDQAGSVSLPGSKVKRESVLCATSTSHRSLVDVRGSKRSVATVFPSGAIAAVVICPGGPRGQVTYRRGRTRSVACCPLTIRGSRPARRFRRRKKSPARYWVCTPPARPPGRFSVACPRAASQGSATRLLSRMNSTNPRGS